MTELFFIRHGVTAWNEAKRIQGRRDEPLLPDSFAWLSRHRLPARRGESFRWFSSPLRRALETARALGAPEPVIVPALIEMDWGEWEGRSLPELREEFGEAMRENEARGLDFETAAGDSPRRVAERVRAWLGEVAAQAADAADERTLVAVSHKGVGRALLALAIGWDMRDRAPVRLDWACAHRFELSATGAPRLVEPNIALEPLVAPEPAPVTERVL